MTDKEIEAKEKKLMKEVALHWKEMNEARERWREAQRKLYEFLDDRAVD